MKKILLFGSGKSATSLIRFLAGYCEKNDHEFMVCDHDRDLAASKIKGFTRSRAASVDVTDKTQLQLAVSKADLVISLLPPSLHILVAGECIRFSRSLLTASYVDEQLKNLADEIGRRGILFLSEMGLDPGIDHMSAMHIIDRLKEKNAQITSFYSHCGGLVSPESDDNPWHYKITWNPRNVVTAGNAGARFLKEGREVQIGYKDVFSFDNQQVVLPGVGTLAWYANRDSMPYLHTYGLTGLISFIRTTLRHPSYNRGWNIVVHLGLTDTDDKDLIAGCNTINDWFEKKKSRFKAGNPLSPVLAQLNDPVIKSQFAFLGLSDETGLPTKNSSADILLSLLENKLVMRKDDKDMIVMIHDVEYEIGGRREKLTSSLIVKGTDSLNTAMAKTVGTPLAIAATLILEGKINLSGLHIPVIPEIYEPVLAGLRKNGISFTEKVGTI